MTAVSVSPYGVAYADDTGRVYLIDVTEALSDAKTVDRPDIGKRETVWVGSSVTALTVTETARLVSGDTDGRLISFTIDDLGQSLAPNLIASADKPWFTLLSAGRGEWVAIAIDGTWARLDRHSVLIGEGTLPVSRGMLIEAHCCADHELLVYRLASGGNDGGNGKRGDNGWQAWSFADRSPVPLPDVLRFAPALATTQRTVLAFNAQGGSWMGVPSGDGIASRQLKEWPVGHLSRVTPLDDRPVVARIDRNGAMQALSLEDDTWRQLDLPIPTVPVADLWTADPSAWSRVNAERQERKAAELSSQALTAQQQHRGPERDALLQRLDQMAGGRVRAALLRSRFAAEDGRWLDAVEELCNSVVRRGGLLHPQVQKQLGKLLWQIGDLPELSAFAPEYWPDIFNTSSEAVSQHCHAIDIPCLIDAYAPYPPEGCCWSELAWPALKRWGSPSPCWLGAEREPPLALYNGDQDLLPRVMTACGATQAPLRVLTPDGVLQDREGWVVSEPIGNGMHRQLAAWVERKHAGTSRLALRWAVWAERFASPSSWIVAWDAMHDRAWRDEHQHRIEVIHQAMTHGVVPDAAYMEQAWRQGVVTSIEEEATS
ncbi:MAG: hypothetical protein ACE37H_08030 [Phycisphaeraceae bacterium]